MKIITAHFDHPGKNDYSRLLKVWKYSVKKHMPHAKIDIIKLNPPRVYYGNTKGFANNKIKLDAYSKLDITENTILIDCDTIILDDLSTAFNQEFDVGLTKRTASKWPTNGGVVFLQPTKKAKKFLKKWNHVDGQMFVNKAFHYAHRQIYGGMNQSSLGFILSEQKVKGLNVAKFECRHWNACNEDWINFDDTVKVLHIKGDLRKVALHGDIAQYYCDRPDLYKTAVKWREYEREAEGCE